MALLAKLRRQRCASGEGEDGENRVLGDPFIETQRCFCLQHRGLEPEENEQLVEPLLNECGCAKEILPSPETIMPVLLRHAY